MDSSIQHSTLGQGQGQRLAVCSFCEIRVPYPRTQDSLGLGPPSGQSKGCVHQIRVLGVGVVSACRGTYSGYCTFRAIIPDHLTEADIIQKTPRMDAIRTRKMVGEYEWVTTQHLWHSSGPTQDSFEPIHQTPTLQDFWAPLSTFCYATARSLRSLKELNVGCNVFEKVDFWTLLSLLPSGMESLSVICQLFPFPNPLPKPNPNMRVLLQTRGKTTVSGLFALLGIFPNLVRLSVDEVQRNPSSPSDPNFYPVPPDPHGGNSLRKLDCDGHVDWENLLHHIPSMVEREGHFMLEGWMEEYFGQHYPNLESFRSMVDPEYIDELWRPREEHDHTNQFLVANRPLKEFDSIQNFIKVDEMLRQPWACMGPERLTCRIVGVNRLNDEDVTAAAKAMVPGYSSELTEEEKSAVEKFHRCRAQHHGVYDRLTSLTRLKHLDLGYENRYPMWWDGGGKYRGEDGEFYLKYVDKPTFDTLELTLESGLGRLAALKDLEMFGFECLNHRIGRAELDWMAKSWPKLKLIDGLDRERLFRMEHGEERTALRRHFRQLRPDVVHDSSYFELSFLFNMADWG